MARDYREMTITMNGTNGIAVTTANQTWTFAAGTYALGDYVEVTAFGDTTRTFINAQPQTIMTIPDIEGREVRLTFNPWRRTVAETETTDGSRDEEISTAATAQVDNGQLATGYLRLYGNHMWTNNAIATTTNTGYEFVPGAEAAANIRFTTNPQIYQQLRDQLTALEHGTWRAFSPVDMEAQAASEKRALALLKRHLSDAQRKDLQRSDSFYVAGKTLIYRISANGQVRTGNPHGDFCFSPYQHIIPGPDQALSLKLMIEADEAEFLRVANWSGIDGENVISLGRMHINGHATQTEFAARLYGGGRRVRKSAKRYTQAYEYEIPE